MKVCMVTYSFYEGDTRVMRYAEALAERGDEVDVIALGRDEALGKEIVHGVNVFRIQGRKSDSSSRTSYALGVVFFFFRSMFLITRTQFRGPYRLIHIHSVPDFLVFSAWLPRLLGAKIILDIHDLLPEFYASKYEIAQTSITFKLLVAIERVSAAFAHHVIAANDIWLTRIVSRSCTSNKCTALVNVPDLQVFSKQGKRHGNGRFVIIYPGSLNWHQGLDIAIRAFDSIKHEVPYADFQIYGEGPGRAELVQLVQELQLSERVIIKNPMSTREIARVIEDADLGVVPKRRDGFGDEAFSTKIMEFMALGVPVIVSDTTVDTYYFDSSIVHFFRAGDEQDLGRAMLLLIRDARLRDELARNAASFVGKNNWGVLKKKYFEIVDSLVGRSETENEMEVEGKLTGRNV